MTASDPHPFYARPAAPARLGVFCAGLDQYWPQFPTLRGELMRCHEQLVGSLRRPGVDVVDAGMSDSSRRAGEVGDELRRAGVDLLVCNLVTYTPAANVLPVVQRAGGPVIMTALHPARALDYGRATTHMQLLNDNVTSLPEVCCALRRAGLDAADAVVGTLEGDARAADRLLQWTDIARCRRVLRRARIGLMGHVYEGMLDMNSDPTMFEGAFGLHVPHVELDELGAHAEAVAPHAVDERLALIRELFHFPQPGSDPLAGIVDPHELAWAARVSLGMESLVAAEHLDALAYYHRGVPGGPLQRLVSGMIIGASLLTGRGVPVAGEADLKNAVAMLILDRLGAGGSFAELHPVDFDGDFVLVGHDGPHHVGIASGRPALRGLTLLHGKVGRGPSVEFAIRHGPITLLGVTQTHDGRFKFVVAQGQSLPGPIPGTGNTNTRARFAPDVRTFLERWSLEGPTHHFAMGVGHHADTLQRLAATLGVLCASVA